MQAKPGPGSPCMGGQFESAFLFVVPMAIEPSLLYENRWLQVEGEVQGGTEFHPFPVVEVACVGSWFQFWLELSELWGLSARAPWSRVAACLKIVGPFPNYMCKRITWELVRMQILWPLLPETGSIGCAQELPCTIGSCLSCSCHISLRELRLCSLDPHSSPWLN